MPVPDRFDYVLGTQNIGGTYHFTNQTLLVEGAEKIREMGSNVLKLRLGPNYAVGGYTAPPDAHIQSLTELARDEPSYRRVFDMPFADYVIWTYCFSTYQHVTPWHGRMKPDILAREYREIYNLTQYLLTTYSGSGKTFYLGNWEGDWHLLSGAPDDHKPKWEKTPNADAVPGMIDWINTRQKAVDDAKRDTPHHDVQVYHYLEVNLVQKGIKGQRCVTRDVLPQTPVDFVSYSSYDSLQKDIARDLPAALDFIAAHLPPKAGVAGQRVFIGEYGFGNLGPAAENAQALKVMKAGLGWGCPFVLFWELYDNEVAKNGRLRSFWLIDDHGTKQPTLLHASAFFTSRPGPTWTPSRRRKAIRPMPRPLTGRRCSFFRKRTGIAAVG